MADRGDNLHVYVGSFAEGVGYHQMVYNGYTPNSLVNVQMFGK